MDQFGFNFGQFRYNFIFAIKLKKPPKAAFDFPSVFRRLRTTLG